MFKHKINTKSGITLIALVVTIIVLLLLAGISVQMLTGDNGILKRAGEAKINTVQSGDQEQLTLIANDWEAEKLTKPNTNIETYLDKQVASNSIDEYESIGDGLYTIKKGEQELILDDGKVYIWRGIDAISTELKGSGTEDDPFLIRNGADLKFLSNAIDQSIKYIDKEGNEKDYKSASYKQVKDVYLNDVNQFDKWNDESINANLNQLYISRFEGNYEGNNKKIVGFYINEPTKIGFFKVLYYANINNLNFENSYVIGGSSSVGILCGSADVTNITNCKVGGIVQGTYYVGGLCGVYYGDYRGNNSCSVRKCINTANITGNTWVGGLFGKIYGYDLATIEECKNNGIITASQHVGGICGECSVAIINNNTNNNNILGLKTTTAYYYLGGIAGEIRGSDIGNCINKGNIIINNTNATINEIGGIVGYTQSSNNKNTSISNSKNMGNIEITVESDSNSQASWIGGIIGCGNNTTINRTNNSGNITLSQGLVDNGTCKGVGGIIGYISNNITITESISNGTITAPSTITWGEQVGYQNP